MDRTRVRGLTDRQRELLMLLANGYTNKEAGEEMGISRSAVQQMIGRIHLRLGTRTRAGAVAVAVSDALSGVFYGGRP